MRVGLDELKNLLSGLNSVILSKWGVRNKPAVNSVVHLLSNPVCYSKIRWFFFFQLAPLKKLYSPEVFYPGLHSSLDNEEKQKCHDSDCR